jgi:hypothetical protein
MGMRSMGPTTWTTFFTRRGDTRHAVKAEDGTSLIPRGNQIIFLF